MGELRNHATRRSGSRVFRTSLEARSEVEKKTALVKYKSDNVYIVPHISLHPIKCLTYKYIFKIKIVIFPEYNQQRCVSQFIYFCKTLYMFQAVFPSIIRSSQLHIQRQVFVRPILLPAASLASQAPDDGCKNCLKHVECLTEINKL